MFGRYIHVRHVQRNVNAYTKHGLPSNRSALHHVHVGDYFEPKDESGKYDFIIMSKPLKHARE